MRACEAWQLPSEDAELLRFGENAIFRLGQRPLVLRIGRSPDKLPVVNRELCVARWLENEAVTAARPYEGVFQPILIDQHPVSVWHLVEDGEHRPDVADLAILLRQVHSLRDCPCDLPALDPLTRTEQRLRDAAQLNEVDRAFLLARAHTLRESFEELEFVLPIGLVHGDAHTGNLLGQAGRPVLTDFETAAKGPREWDLVPIAVTHTRFGLSEQAYRRFTELYGFDVTAWTGFGVLRDLRELNMTAWLIQNLAEGPAVADEVALRVAAIRNGDTSCEWHAF